MSLTDLLVPTYKQMLKALSGWLDKAQEQLPEAEAVLTARLATDMYPLSTQIRFSCLQAQEATFRLRGEALPESLHELAREGQKADDHPGSMADAKARIDEALAFLDDLAADALDSGAGKSIAIELPNGMIFDMQGEQYARDWALPQFYFHLNTAYAVLRSQKIELGKADYVQHAFAYLRPGSMPGS
ncbi:MAG: DUF1993 domain-containing protein [Pseudomonadota bacterium]